MPVGKGDTIEARFVELIPDAVGVTRIFADDMAAQLFDITQMGLGGETTCRLAQPSDPVIRIEFNKDPVLPRVADHKGLEIGNTHNSSMSG